MGTRGREEAARGAARGVVLLLAPVLLARACAPGPARAALEADVAIDYAAAGNAVSPLVYGGNVHYPWNSIFQRDRDALEALGPHSWRVAWWDNTQDGYRWDTHTVEPDGTIAAPDLRVVGRKLTPTY